MTPNLLKQLRISENLSQAEMAKRLGISQTYLSQIENENEKVSDTIRRRVAGRFVITQDLMDELETLKLMEEII